MLWNKGLAALDTKMDIVIQLIDDEQSDVLTLTEAKLCQDTPAQAVAIPGYKLFTDRVSQP